MRRYHDCLFGNPPPRIDGLSHQLRTVVDTQNVLLDDYWTRVTRMKLLRSFKLFKNLGVGEGAGQGTIYLRQLNPTTMAFEIPKISLRANRPSQDIVKDIRNACLVHGFFQVVGAVANACAVRMNA
jgi:hypothetical protein